MMRRREILRVGALALGGMTLDQVVARRAAAGQAGRDTAVINIYFDTTKSGPGFTNWDDHSGNAGRPGRFATFLRTRLP